MDLLALGLAMLVGFVFGYSACLWRWCAAEEAREKAHSRSTEGQYGQTIRPDGRRCNDPRDAGFDPRHDCVRERCEGCTIPHGGKNSDR